MLEKLRNNYKEMALFFFLLSVLQRCFIYNFENHSLQVYILFNNHTQKHSYVGTNAVSAGHHSEIKHKPCPSIILNAVYFPVMTNSLYITARNTNYLLNKQTNGREIMV